MTNNDTEEWVVLSDILDQFDVISYDSDNDELKTTTKTTSKPIESKTKQAHLPNSYLATTIILITLSYLADKSLINAHSSVTNMTNQVPLHYVFKPCVLGRDLATISIFNKDISIFSDDSVPNLQCRSQPSFALASFSDFFGGAILHLGEPNHVAKNSLIVRPPTNIDMIESPSNLDKIEKRDVALRQAYDIAIMQQETCRNLKLKNRDLAIRSISSMLLTCLLRVANKSVDRRRDYSLQVAH